MVRVDVEFSTKSPRSTTMLQTGGGGGGGYFDALNIYKKVELYYVILAQLSCICSGRHTLWAGNVTFHIRHVIRAGGTDLKNRTGSSNSYVARGKKLSPRNSIGAILE